MTLEIKSGCYLREAGARDIFCKWGLFPGFILWMSVCNNPHLEQYEKHKAES